MTNKEMVLFFLLDRLVEESALDQATCSRVKSILLKEGNAEAEKEAA